VAERLKEQNIILEVTPEAKELIIEKGFDPIFGARPLKRTIQRYLEDPLASEIIAKKFPAGSKVKVLRKNEELIFSL
ncbi:MAG: chaperone protein ClpB, partial [Candidatus Omnitrophica bacterium]|nr:chaperone protein ClpB [Candidatus Omnitrophota bacterium]